LRREVAEIERLDGRIVGLGQVEVVGRQPMTEAPAARVHLDIERVAFDVALQLDEMVATAQRAELRNATFGPTLASPGHLPGVVDREPISLGACSIDALTEVLRVVRGAAADDGLEFLLAQMLETRTADLPGTEGDPPGHRAVEAQPILRRCGRDGHFARGRHHAAVVDKYASLEGKVAELRNGQAVDVLP